MTARTPKLRRNTGKAAFAGGWRCANLPQDRAANVRANVLRAAKGSKHRRPSLPTVTALSARHTEEE